MKTTLHTDWTVDDICKGFVFDKNEGKGLLGLDGQLIIQAYHPVRVSAQLYLRRRQTRYGKGVSGISGIISHDSCPVLNVGNASPSVGFAFPTLSLHVITARLLLAM